MAKSPEQRNMERRLDAILGDEEYGPKLVRLNKTDERKVLNLVERGKGREARQMINKLDEERRADNRIKTRVRQYIHRTPIERSQNRPVDESRRFWELYDQGIVG